MKRIFTLFISLVALVQVVQAQQPLQRISVTDFGALPNSREDTREAFARAIEACGGRDAIIEFPQGRYDFWADSLQDITTAMYLRDARNITIEGNGSEFVFHGKMQIVFVERSQGVSLRNFTTDWDRPYISQGEFVAIGDGYVDLRIDPVQYPFQIVDNRIRFLGEGWSYDGHTLHFVLQSPQLASLRQS